MFGRVVTAEIAGGGGSGHGRRVLSQHGEKYEELVTESLEIKITVVDKIGEKINRKRNRLPRATLNEARSRCNGTGRVRQEVLTSLWPELTAF